MQVSLSRMQRSELLMATNLLNYADPTSEMLPVSPEP
jgi:hypothetical protein